MKASESKDFVLTIHRPAWAECCPEHTYMERRNSLLLCSSTLSCSMTLDFAGVSQALVLLLTEDSNSIYL